MSEVRFLTFDPGHFHAALVQKEMYPGVSPQSHVYAPLGPDVVEHLNRVARFNTRAEKPTRWAIEVHTSDDFYERMLRERPGNVVVFSGRNRGKIDRILGTVEAGLNVLADKPWVIASADLPKLERALAAAEKNGLVAYDIMTERYEITSILQRELASDPEIFGDPLPGTPDDPGVYMESVHYIMKTVAGAPLLRPPWFFDITQQGEALSDVGTHLVDLVQWTLFPNRAIDYRTDIELLAARRWPTVLNEAQFRKVTNEPAFPAYLNGWMRDGNMEYFCNTQVLYWLRGIHVKMDVLWKLETPAGAGDTHLATYRGTKSRIEVRQGAAEKFRPELYVNTTLSHAEEALRKRVEKLQTKYPGVGLEQRGGEWMVTIPDRYRVGHEAHFAQVTLQFLEYLKNPASMPAWEKPNMLAKYFVCSKGVEMAATARGNSSGRKS